MNLESLLFLLGGGSIATVISVLFQHFQKKQDNKIDWYDRAVAQVKEMDENVKELKELLQESQDKNKELTKENIELQRAIMKMEISIDRLKDELLHYEKQARSRSQKGGGRHGVSRNTDEQRTRTFNHPNTADHNVGTSHQENEHPE